MNLRFELKARPRSRLRDCITDFGSLTFGFRIFRHETARPLHRPEFSAALRLLHFRIPFHLADLRSSATTARPSSTNACPSCRCCNFIGPRSRRSWSSCCRFRCFSRCSFALGRMSRSNEIVSMLTAGVSVPRLVLPLLLIGLLTTGVTLGFNYSLAAHAELARKNFFDEVKRGGPRDVVISGQVFRNRTDNRTWYISRFRPNTNEFSGVQIVQQDRAGKYRPELHRDRCLLRTGDEKLAAGEGESRGLRRRPATSRTKSWSIPDDSRLERNSLSLEQRQRPAGVSRHLRAARVFAFQRRFSADLARPFPHPVAIPLGPALDLFRRHDHGGTARDRLLASRHSLERGGGDRARLYR